METLLLCDVGRGVYVESLNSAGLFTADVTPPQTWSVSKQRLSGGLSEGVDVVTLTVGELSVRVLPTRGMGLWDAKFGTVRCGWEAPVRHPVNPAFVDLQRRGGIGWLDGFNEWLCRCGLAYHGPPGTDVIRDSAGNTVSETPVTLHGRIANLPASHVRVEIDHRQGSLAVVGIIEETSLFDCHWELTSRLEISVHNNGIRIVDTIRNAGATPADFELLYHINNGPPLLEENSRIEMAVDALCPRDPRAAEGIQTWSECGPPTTAFAEQAYFVRPLAGPDGFADVLLTTAAADSALQLRFGTDLLSWLTLWKNTQSIREGYVVGLEPATSLPNLVSFERNQGRLKTLQPDETATTELRLSHLATPAAVGDVLRQIQELQGTQSPRIHPQPLPDWSPSVAQ